MKDLLTKYYDKELSAKLSDMNYVSLIKLITNSEKEGNNEEVNRQIASYVFHNCDLEEIFFRSSLLAFLNGTPSDGLYVMLEKAKLIIPSKLRKKGKRKVVERIMSKLDAAYWHRKMKLIYYTWMHYTLPEIMDKELEMDVVIEKIKKFSDTYEDTSSLYIFPVSVGRMDIAEKSISLVVEEDMDTVCDFLVQGLISIKFSQDTKQNNPMVNIAEEKKRLERKLMRQKKREKQLNKEIYGKTQKEKDLKREIHELDTQLQKQYDDALTEISQLEEKIEKMQKQYKEEILAKENKIEYLKHIIEYNRYKMEEYKPLNNLNILVIGHPSGRNSYHKLITQYGGCFLFFAVDGKGLRELEGLYRRADYVIYVTSYNSHTIANKLLSIEDSNKILYANSGGIATIENIILNKIIPNQKEILI